jgi:hypothetical protein
VVEWVKEVERDSWASFKTTRSTAHAKQLLANLAACVVAWAAAVRHGGAGRGPARGGERRARARALEGTWHGEERRGGSWGLGNGQQRRQGHGRREKQRGGLEVDNED